MAEYSSIKEALDKCGTYTGLTMGGSMWPLIHQQKDNIIVVKCDYPLKKYDVPVYITKSGKYVMHRIIDVKPDCYVIMGDNLLVKEYVTQDMIIGKLVGFYKNGKKYIDVENSKAYKLYSRISVALIPVRPVIFAVHKFFYKIKIRVTKRG
jgi:signal peptidase I